MSATLQVDPRLDLLLERVVDVPPELVWAAWTVPEHVKKWFTPAPWVTINCEIDLRPGGIFRTVMRGPEGQEINNIGCFLEIMPSRKLVWTVGMGFSEGCGRPIPALTFRPLPRSSAWSRTGLARNTAPSPCTRTKRAATDTSGWDSARGGAGRSINSSLTPRRCGLRVDRNREQSVRKFPATLRLIIRGKRRINPIFSVLFKLILDPGA